MRSRSLGKATLPLAIAALCAATFAHAADRTDNVDVFIGTGITAGACRQRRRRQE